MTWFEKQGREGLIPKKVSETVHPKEGLPFERLSTVYVKPEVPDFVNDWLEDFDSKTPVYLVGGSVRDSLLGETPKDIDVITFQPKEDIEASLKNSKTKFYQGGKNLPNLLTANLGKDQLIDIVSMDTDIGSELVRRDFTINAMAQRPDGEIIDPFGGRKDLKEGVLRSPKDDSDKVFEDDPLRMLRAARFIGDLNLKPHSSVTQAIQKHKDLLSNLPKERIGMEFGRILYSKDPISGLKFLKDNDMLKYIDPALQRMVGFVQNIEGHDYDVWNHTLKSLEHHITKDKKSPDLATRLGILYHNVGKPATANSNNSNFDNYESIGAQIVEESLNSLRLPSDMIDTVRKLVQHHTSAKTAKTEGDHRRVQLKLRHDLNKLNYVATAHEVGKEGNVNADTSHIVEFQDTIDKLDPVSAEGEGSSKLSPLSGKEIMDALNIVPNKKGGGERIGKIKDFLDNLVVEGELKQSDKEGALERAKQYHSTFTMKSTDILKGWLNILKDEDITGEAFAGHTEDADGNLVFDASKKKQKQEVADWHANFEKQKRLDAGLIPKKLTDKNGIEVTRWINPKKDDVEMDKNSPNFAMRDLKHTYGTSNAKELWEKYKKPVLDKKTGEHLKDEKTGELKYTHSITLPHPEDSKSSHYHGEGRKGKKLGSSEKWMNADNIHFDDDPFSLYPIKATNEKGKIIKDKGPTYDHPEHTAMRWKTKAAGVTAIYMRKDPLNDALEAEYKKDNPALEAIMTGLMFKSGIRVGNPADAKELLAALDKPASFGASSLQKQHLRIDGDKIYHKFPGKKKTMQEAPEPIVDANLAKALTKIMKNKKDDDFIFQKDNGVIVNEGSTQKWHNKAMKIHPDNPVTNHNFRTFVGTSMAVNNVADFLNNPEVIKELDKTNKLPIKTKGEFKDFTHRMAIDSAKQLSHVSGDGNKINPQITLDHYIKPDTFTYKQSDGKNVLIESAIDDDSTKISKEYQDFMEKATGKRRLTKEDMILKDPENMTKSLDGKEFDPTRKKEKDIDTYFENRKEKEEDRNYGLDKIPAHMRPRPKYFAKTWIEDLAEKGFQAPIVKSISPDGSKMWFIEGGTDFVASLGASGVGHVEKATFPPLPSNATNKISYAPSASNKRREEDTDEEE
jgi:tRNA nucleotidyltransferase/poly(A) polymerase|tara:strand:+ start:1771 stop:5160 length:3390 start_codon:yes stop_codon:yes gene_type:complete